jgi:hypothetical protein
MERPQRPLSLPSHQRRLCSASIRAGGIVVLSRRGLERAAGMGFMGNDTYGEHRLGRVTRVERGDRGHGEEVAVVAGGFGVVWRRGQGAAEFGEDGLAEGAGKVGEREHGGPGLK